MYFFFIGLFLVAFHVTCHGAPERLIPVPQLPVDVRQEKKQVEKRALCTDDQLDVYPQSNGCPYWASSGFCDASSVYHQFMQDNCYASCSNCEVAPTPVPVVDEAACLTAHNDKRALHQDTDALVWDDTLAEHAQTWADNLAATGTSEHDKNRPSNEGENLYWYWTSNSNAATCTDAVNSWYEEISLYSYTNPPQDEQEFYAGGYGHFTQVVWRGTTHVGAALKKVPERRNGTDGFATYIVARYSPPGNYIGHSRYISFPVKNPPKTPYDVVLAQLKSGSSRFEASVRGEA